MKLDHNKIRFYDCTIFIVTALFLVFGLYEIIDINNPDSDCYICKSHYNKAYRHNKIVCVPGNLTAGNSEIYYKNAGVSGYCETKWAIMISIVVLSFLLGSGYLTVRVCCPIEFLYDTPEPDNFWYSRA